jgi:hypothetical protein
MARIKISRPAIIDTPASFTDLTATGDLTILGSASFSGSFTFSGSFDGGNATFNNITASILKVNTSTQLTLSSSFSTTLNFSINRIMITHSVQPLTMSIDANASTLGNVIMTDISASGLDLTSSEFKILNGTFDNTKRNYVYYHYIGNDTALVTINQES